MARKTDKQLIDEAIELEDGPVMDDLAKEVSKLQRQVKRLQAVIKGHREHMAEVLGPNPCDGAAEFEFGGKKVQVIHNHELESDKIALLYPISDYPMFWEHKPNTRAIRAVLSTEQIAQLTCCGSHYVKVS